MPERSGRSLLTAARSIALLIQSQIVSGFRELDTIGLRTSAHGGPWSLFSRKFLRPSSARDLGDRFAKALSPRNMYGKFRPRKSRCIFGANIRPTFETGLV